MNYIANWKCRPARRAFPAAGGSLWFQVGLACARAGCVASSCTRTPRSMTRQTSILLVHHCASTINSPWDLMQMTIPQMTGGSRSRELSAQLLSRSPQDCCLPTSPAQDPHTGSTKWELPGENVKHLTLVPCFHVEAWHLRNVGRRRADFCGGRLKRNYKVSTFFAPRYFSFQATPTDPTPTKHAHSARFPIYEQKAAMLSATLRDLRTDCSYLPRGHLRIVGTSMWDVSVGNGAKGERSVWNSTLALLFQITVNVRGCTPI